MKLSFYTIDDLRLGYDPQGEHGWRQSHFLDWRDALAHYRSLADGGVKAFGVSNGDQSLELVRHVFADMDSTVQEDVLVLDFLGLPLWKKEETVICLAKELVAQLNIRYCLAVERLVPPPAEKTSTQWLEGKFLWPNTPGAPESAIRWLYLAGTGWISPTELKRRYPAPEQTCRYPLITRYRVDGVASDGIFVPLDLSHWEYKLLEHRTQERLDHKKFEGGKQL